MSELKAYILMFFGALFSLLAPIHNFMYAMLILFGLNFVSGLVSARAKKEKWSTKKALMFFVYCAIFLTTACVTFIIGHLMGEHQQAVATVKILCYLALYIFGTNIFRNLRHVVPEGTAWYRLFDLCFYILSVKFVEKLPFIKDRSENVQAYEN